MNLHKKENLKCKSFWINKKDLYKFIIDETDTHYFLNIFGENNRVYKSTEFEKLFIYVTETYFAISLIEKFEYALLSSMNLVEVYEHYKWEFPQEKKEMFNNFVIEDVVFGEVNEVALETAVEKIASDLQGVEIKTKNDKTYLVKDGSAIELNGDEFIALVEKYVKGKTVNALSKNREMFTLIKNLGIIKEVKLTSKDSGLSSIFG